MPAFPQLRLKNLLQHTHTHALNALKHVHPGAPGFMGHLEHQVCPGLPCPSPLRIMKVKASAWSSHLPLSTTLHIEQMALTMVNLLS
jgi:hypothetical protein